MRYVELFALCLWIVVLQALVILMYVPYKTFEKVHDHGTNVVLRIRYLWRRDV